LKLDLPAAPADHGGMDSPQPAAPPAPISLIIWRALALTLAAILATLVFAAYTQPELLLNYSGLRYCG
jgi:hypothetical protein